MKNFRNGKYLGEVEATVLFFLSMHVCSVTQSVWFFTTPWIVTDQAPLSMDFSRQEYWNGWPFPTPGDLSYPEIQLTSLTLAGEFFTTEKISLKHTWLLRVKTVCDKNNIKRGQLTRRFYILYEVWMHAQLLQSGPTLCNRTDLALQAPLSLGFSKARVLERLDMSSSKGSSQPRDWTRSIFCIFCIASGFFTTEPPSKPTLYEIVQSNSEDVYRNFTKTFKDNAHRYI